MYNRYMPKVQDVNDYIEVGKTRPPQTPPPPPAPGPLPEDMPPLPPFYGRPPRPAPPPPAPEDTPAGLGGLLAGLHMPKLELDDLLLLAIVFLVLREDGDEDLMLIIAALYLLGQN